MKENIARRSGIRRLLGIAAVVGMLAAGAVVGVAAPAAAADSWRTISTNTSCTSYSFGRLCTVRTTQLRQVSYCTRPPILNPYGNMTWAQYCLRYTERSYWA